MEVTEIVESKMKQNIRGCGKGEKWHQVFLLYTIWAAGY